MRGLRTIPETVWLALSLGVSIGLLVGIPFGAFVARLP